jgi:sugar lactone lactonase YvrE
MDMSGHPNAGSLYMLDVNHQVSVKIKEVSCSNCLAWSADNKKFYFIDTP